jgi:hypothetical protein
VDGSKFLSHVGKSRCRDGEMIEREIQVWEKGEKQEAWNSVLVHGVLEAKDRVVLSKSH